MSDAAGLLAARLARRSGGRAIPAHPGSTAPLTATQEGMWFEAQVDPRRAGHHRPTVIRVGGSLDVDRLRRALRDVVRRQPALTTSYPLVGLRPRQQPPRPPDGGSGAEVEVVDLVVDASLDPAAPARAVAAAATRAFDLAHAGPLAATLVRRSADDHLLVLALSHLAIDGPSAELLVADLAAAYAADPAGVSAAAAAPTPSFADWAAWEADRIPPERREDDLDWWSHLLAHRPTRPPLAWVDPGHPDPAPGRGARRVGTARLATDGQELGWEVVGAELADALRSLARVEGATMHAVTLAGFQALWWAGQAVDDLVVGVPVSDRDHPDLASVIGCFVRVLPLRLRAGPADTGRDLVRRVSALSQVALAHRRVSLPEITAALGTRTPDGVVSEVVDVHFQYRREASAARTAGEVTLELETVLDAGTRISVLVLDDGQELTVASATPAGGLVESRRLAQAVVGALGELVRSPDRPLRPADPSAAATNAATASARPGPPSGAETTLVGLFERTVAAHGSRPACRDATEVVTYAELDRRARATARRLAELGVGPGDPVVLQLSRSIEWLVAMLGVVLAGGVYVPVDPESPAARTEAMLADIGPTAIVRPDGIERLTTVTSSDPALAGRAADDGERVAGWSGTGAQAPVYVLFTSGSTGRPKGVAVTHANVVQLVEDPGYLPMTADDVVVFSSNPTFDGTTIEIWGALAAGACVVVLESDVLVDPRRLEAALRDQGVTVLGMTTALFKAVARHRPGAFASLRVASFGGEACDPRWVRAVMAAGPPRRLMHDYGPTETTCAVAYHDVVAIPEPGAVVPMGAPLTRATLHVLDPAGRRVVAGVPGELAIGGAGVALGYVGRAELTAERFVPDPFSADPDARLYRSGDLVVQRPDGIFEFLGRLDTQVKLRGYRIELGEIEAALTDHPGIDLAAVGAWAPDPAAEAMLVAYVVTGPECSWTDDELVAEVAAHLASRVPPYMHPRRVVRLDGLPTTATGKLDRRALPPPASPPAQAPATDRRPASGDPTGLEAMLGLWRTVLETDGIGPDDHFFDVGGHSLRAMALLAAIRDEFRVDLRVADLASADTPARLAQVISRHDLLTSPDGLIELHPGLAGEPVLFIPSGVAVHYLTGYRRLAQQLDLDRLAVTFEAPGMAPGSVPRYHVEGLVRWYRRLIDLHQPTGALRLIGHSLGGILALEVARHAQRDGRDIAAVVLLDPRLPPAPAAGLHRARVVASSTARRTRAQLSRTSGRARAGAATGGIDADLRTAAGHALARYRARPWDGPVTLAVATGVGDRGPGRRGGTAMVARWEPLLSNLTVVEVPGTHVGPESILDDRHVDGTAAAVRPALG